MFDETQLAYINQTLLKELNSQSMSHLHSRYNEQTCCDTTTASFYRDHRYDNFLQAPTLPDARFINQQWAAATLIQKHLRGQLVRRRMAGKYEFY